MLRILSRFMIVLSFTAAVLSSGAAELRAATITYIVGTCKAGTQFTTIQGALNASPSPNVVQVCPGTYTEQLTITNAVTLEGISAGNSALIRITPPAAGLATNATINGSDRAAVHVFVKNATGEVRAISPRPRDSPAAIRMSRCRMTFRLVLDANSSREAGVRFFTRFGNLTR